MTGGAPVCVLLVTLPVVTGGEPEEIKKKGSSMVRNAPKIRIVKPDIRPHNGKMPDVQPKMQQILKMASSAHLLTKTLPVPVL